MRNLHSWSASINPHGRNGNGWILTSHGTESVQIMHNAMQCNGKSKGSTAWQSIEFANGVLGESHLTLTLEILFFPIIMIDGPRANDAQDNKPLANNSFSIEEFTIKHIDQNKWRWVFTSILLSSTRSNWNLLQ